MTLSFRGEKNQKQLEPIIFVGKDFRKEIEYAKAKLKYLDNDPLPFVFESTGIITRFRDTRDPKPRGRNIFSFFRPETLAEWLKKEKSLRGRLQDIPKLNTEGLRPAQINAIQNLEQSFKKNKPKALIQMATGAGKTFTAATFVYRLLKYADAKRILFLVDTKNLGEQADVIGRFITGQERSNHNGPLLRKKILTPF